MKEVFVQLVTAGSRTAFKHPIPALIQVADALYGPTLIAHLQIAVYDQCKSQVGHADVNELYICHPGSVIGSYLDPTGLLQDGMYIAEIPAVPEPGVITSMVRETLLLRWAAAGARSQLVYASGGQVALLTAHMLENTGAGRPGGGPLTLFCRQQFIQQCSDMNRHSIENEAIQWIVGPPGIGKSCAALAFAHTLDPASWDVLWLSFSPEREAFMCVWLRGGDKVTCVIDLTDLQLLAQVLNATSPTKHTVLFLDGYATSPYEMENARLRCKKWHYEDKALHRLIYICSMAGVSKKYRRERYTVIRPSSEATGQHSRDVDMKYTDVTKLPDAAMKPATPSETELRDAGMKSSVSSVAETGRDEEVMSEMLCRLESWRFSDYQSAIRCDAFYHSVSDKFEGLNALANPAEEKARVLEQKYCIAGGSARLMFEVSSAKAFAALNDVIAEISNTDLMSQASSRALSPCAINRLQAGYYRPDNEYETCFVSEYVARRFAVLNGPALFQKVATLCDVNPAMDGHLFEAWFLAMVSACGIKLFYYNRFMLQNVIKWNKTETVFFDSNRASIAAPLADARWIVSTQWSEGGYDAVYVNKTKKVVRFVQATRAETHTYDANFFIEFLYKLVEHDDMKGVRFKRAELYFVVPMARLQEFVLPVTSKEFGDVVGHVAEAPSPALGTRSHRYEMFHKCKSLVRVAGVETRRRKKLHCLR